MELLKQTLLRTLSFYEPMTKEMILLDLDATFFELNPYLTLDDLEKMLRLLVAEKLIEVKGSGRNKTWQRLVPKRSLKRHLKSFF